MIILLICCGFSKIQSEKKGSGNPPLVIFPPMFGSVLFGTVKNVPTPHWFCLKNLKDSWIWETDQYLISPLTDCMAAYLQCGWNYTTNRPDSRNESYIYTVDFGGDQGIRYLDRGIFGYHLVHDMDGFLENMEGRGFKVREDMFGAPYDWRLSPIGIEQFYIDAKKLIEDIYVQCNNKKVTIFSYSGGCFSLHYFLTKKVSQDWKDKYIDHVIFVGPSYAGSADAIICLWTGLSWFPGASSAAMSDMLLSLPTLYSHFPNYVVHKDMPGIIGPKGEVYSFSQLKQLMYDQGKIDNIENRKIFDFAEKDVLNNDIDDPGVDSYIIFNSLIPTLVGLNFSNSTEVTSNEIDINFLGVKKTLKLNKRNDDDWGNLQAIMGEGDGCLSKEALYYGCKAWKSGHTVVCHDYKSLNETYNHGALLTIPEILDDIYQNIVNDSWRQKKGNFVLEGSEKNYDNMKKL
ncbi:hypothetical protein M9Y10_032088 [Tritrichomonas musculus]|uniref:Lecithin:cholesterol acyltransferase family protein n=1 Tax=Tritrichomonas musculus TaxID=1915356 RepID=A0ABR2GZQ0_9EUKA